MENLKELFDLINIFNMVIPDGSEESLEVNGMKVTLNKKDGVINISVTSDKDTKEEVLETFDDSQIKEIIKEYKERIEELDDCLFVEAAEEMSKYFNMKRFDELLNQDTFTEQEATEVSEMIDQSSQIICNHLEDKINELVKIYNRF